MRAQVEFSRVRAVRDRDRVVEFLRRGPWPFHSGGDSADVVDTGLAADDEEWHWILDGDDIVGLVRVFDLGDVGEGSPMFDLRISDEHRGRGIGSAATRWVAEHLFEDYPELHRIEATTRHDNVAMQRALSAAGFVEEGRLRRSWRSGDEWFDTLVFGLLRDDPKPPADR